MDGLFQAPPLCLCVPPPASGSFPWLATRKRPGLRLGLCVPPPAPQSQPIPQRASGGPLPACLYCLPVLPAWHPPFDSKASHMAEQRNYPPGTCQAGHCSSLPAPTAEDCWHRSRGRAEAEGSCTAVGASSAWQRAWQRRSPGSGGRVLVWSGLRGGGGKGRPSPDVFWGVGGLERPGPQVGGGRRRLLDAAWAGRGSSMHAWAFQVG